MSEESEADAYGWVLVSACFIIALMTVDSNGSFGIFMIECVERGFLSEVYVTLIGACRFSLAGLSGIVLGGLAQKYGQRKVMIAGSLLVFLGHAGCALWPQLGFFWMMFTYGFISSIGFGCYCLVFATAFQGYFKRRLGLANAIVSTGYSCGMFFWPPILEFFLSTYGWTGGLLLDAALHLHGIALAMLIIPKKCENKLSLATDTVEDQETEHNYTENNNGHNWEYTAVNNKDDCHPKEYFHTSLPALCQDTKGDFDKEALYKFRSLSHNTTKHPLQFLEKEMMHDYSSHILHQSDQQKPVLSEKAVTSLAENTNFRSEIYIGNKNKCTNVWAYCSKMGDVVDFTLLKQTPFLMYCIGMAMVQGGGLGPITLLPTKAVAKGISKVQAAFLISILGISNGIFKILWGLLADIKSNHYYKPLLCGIPAVLSGLVSFLSSVANDFLSFVLLSSTWGILSAGYSSLQYTLIVHLLNGNNISKGAGTLHTLLGISWTVCFFMSGLLMEFCEGVSAPFYSLGGVQIIGGLIIVAIPFTQILHLLEVEHG